MALKVAESTPNCSGINGRCHCGDLVLFVQGIVLDTTDQTIHFLWFGREYNDGMFIEPEVYCAKPCRLPAIMIKSEKSDFISYPLALISRVMIRQCLIKMLRAPLPF